MAEFTGERVIPGQVDADLLNEHLARYAFAARLSRRKQVLDAGCGAGYGSAALARKAASVLGIDRSAAAIAFARAQYPAPNLRFEEADCTALPAADGSIRAAAQPAEAAGSSSHRLPSGPERRTSSIRLCTIAN